MTVSATPEWLRRLPETIESVDPADFVRLPPVQAALRPPRPSGVLMLFGPDEAGRDSIVLTERSHSLRSHAGQVSFPGGRVDPLDSGPVEAALREAHEEIGLDRSRVEVIGSLPELFLPVSDSIVTAVLAWAPTPPPLWVRSPREVDAVARVPLGDLVDPVHRIVATHPAGYRGPAFDLPGIYVWGFTALLLDRVLELAGLEIPWDRSRERPLPDRFGRPMSTDSRLRSGRPNAEPGAVPR